MQMTLSSKTERVFLCFPEQTVIYCMQINISGACREERRRVHLAYDEDLIAGKLRRWEKYLLRFRLPDWEEIPNIGLYMDQVVMLLMGYLDYMPPELKDEQVVTAAAINNYVRKGIMPSPDKKKYFREHIAYLVMICTLKQSLSIAMLQKLLPTGNGEAEVRPVYEAYVRRHRESARFFVQQVRAAAAGILKHPDAGEDAVKNTEDLIASTAIVSGFARLMAEKLLLLDGCDLETGGSIEIE